MIPLERYRGQKIAVLGLGRSGLSVARALMEGGGAPVCWDDDARKRQQAANAGFAIADPALPESWEGVSLLLMSPGIPHLYPAPHKAVELAWAQGVRVSNDVALFFEALEDIAGAKTIAVTGSNGKSTTTELIGHVLRECGARVHVGGNIGWGVCELPGEEDAVYVIELSSYQCELASGIAPHIAVFLNLSDDHLDRHGGRGGYFYAKAAMFRRTREHNIIGVESTEGRFLARQLANGRVTEFDAAVVAGFPVPDTPALRGAHNRQNALAASLAVEALGVPRSSALAAMQGFRGLAHRMEEVAIIEGVRFVNDSKATNADAAEKSLASFERIRWILGGRIKAGSGIKELTPLLGRVEKAYLIGEASEAFAEQLGAASAGLPVDQCDTLERAVAAVIREAKPGETVLLAPASSSFDQFSSFEQRGEVFRELVLAHADARGACE